MGESSNLSRFVNPWYLNFQKLTLELKCPLCLNFFNQPVLLPCNHIFCNRCIPGFTHSGSECPFCKHAFGNQDIRPAPFIGNIIGIIKCLEATLNASLFRCVTSDSGNPPDFCPALDNTNNGDESTKLPFEALIEGNSSNGQSTILRGHKHACASPNGWDENVGLMEKTSKSIMLQRSVECGEFERVEMDMNEAMVLSPNSDTNDAADKSIDPSSSRNCGENYAAKRSAENFDGSVANDMNNSIPVDECDIRDGKRQKKLKFGSSETSLVTNPCIQQKDMHSGNVSTPKNLLGLKNSEPSTGCWPTSTSDLSNANGSVCAFCHSSKSTDITGPLSYYANGKEILGDVSTYSNVIPVHQKCIEWTPQIYYDGDTIKNLETELARAAKLKCSSCGLKGAPLGCFIRSCRRSYHVPCAFETTDCRWDYENYIILCPTHKHKKFPTEKKSKKHVSQEKFPVDSQIVAKQLDFCGTTTNVKELVFCGSALSGEEKYQLVKFANSCGASVSKFWSSSATHVIAATDENGACIRTLKVLMAILNGKWVLTTEWVKACMEARHPVDEEPYEVSLDNHGCADGPRNGRMRALSNATKLFEGLSFYFSGFFLPPYQADLEHLVLTGGGNVIQSKNQLLAQTHLAQQTLVVFNSDPPKDSDVDERTTTLLRRVVEAEKLAERIGATVIRHGWILESIAACELQPFPVDSS